VVVRRVLAPHHPCSFGAAADLLSWVDCCSSGGGRFCLLVVVASDVGCYNGVGVLFLHRRFVCVSKQNMSPRRFGGFVLKFILCSMGF